MEDIRTLIFAVLGLWFSFCIFNTEATECNLDGVHKCVGSASEVLPNLYFNPLRADIIQYIKETHCDKGIETCLQHTEGNCNSSSLVPYQTIVNTFNFLCHTDFDVEQSCLGQEEAQHAFGFCFQMFKVVIENVVSDKTLDKKGLDEAMCGAYYDVSDCSSDASFAMCDARTEVYIANYLNAIRRAAREVQGC